MPTHVCLQLQVLTVACCRRDAHHAARRAGAPSRPASVQRGGRSRVQSMWVRSPCSHPCRTQTFPACSSRQQASRQACAAQPQVPPARHPGAMPGGRVQIRGDRGPAQSTGQCGRALRHGLAPAARPAGCQRSSSARRRSRAAQLQPGCSSSTPGPAWTSCRWATVLHASLLHSKNLAANATTRTLWWSS